MTAGYEYILEAVLCVSLAGLLYTYAGYPILLAIWSLWGSKPVMKKPIRPFVSIVIAARNEASRLAARVKNCLAQNYPADRLEVVVVSDGSEDGTNDVVRQFDAQRVRLVTLETRQGKALALNAGLAVARGEIVVFADARQVFDRSAVSELAANFADRRVGAVCGELMLLPDPHRPGADGMGLYWRIEKWIRRKEGAIDSVVGATGAIYAIRRELFEPLPAGTVLDDVLVPMRIAMKGYRVVFEPKALAFDRVESNYQAEFSRKVRTLAGNYQAIRFCPDLVSPRRNRLFLQFVSHKVWRLAAPFSLAALFLTNVALLGGWFSHLFAMQAIGYGMASIGWWLNSIGVRERWTTAAYTFCLLNAAALVGAIRFVRGDAGLTLWDAVAPQRESGSDLAGV